MTARPRTADETFIDYRINLRKEAKELHQRLKGFWHHISISFTRVPTVDKLTKEPILDPITRKPLTHLMKETTTYRKTGKAAIKADRGARRMHNKINKPSQVHNHG